MSIRFAIIVLALAVPSGMDAEAGPILPPLPSDRVSKERPIPCRSGEAPPWRLR
ncbi:MAG: hypothetical protein IT210_03565 [Armatimonadetes bacterium]|nr:hypothetical protein [Armatimonadota bacterium]